MNIQVTQILELLKSQWENIPEEYKIVIYFAGAVFSVLNCFMGYRLRKVWGCVLGVLAGGGGGAVAGYYFLHDKVMALVCGAAGALILGLLAWLLYKFGVFVMCTGLVYFLIVSRFADATLTQHGIAMVVGVFAGTFALGYEQQMVIAITSICGGLGGIHLLLAMTGKEAGGGELILGLIMAAIGAAAQAFPLMKEKDRSKREAGFLKSGKRRGIPGGRKKKVIKKTRVNYVDKERKPEQGASLKKNRRVHENDYNDEEDETEEYYKNPAEREELDKTQEYAVGKRQYETAKPQNGEPYLAPGIGIDLDDLNRELSQEIRKIYKEDDQQ